MKHSLLVVDDEIDNVDALERIFRRKYKVLKAISGDEGLAQLQENSEIAVIISDQRMPGMTGVEFLKKSIKTHPDTIRILLTGYTDIDAIVSAINSGEVYRYLTKPWDPVDLKNTVDKAVEKYDLRKDLEKKNTALKEALDELKTLDQAKNQFMVLINHELKTPLTVIISFLDLLKETNCDEEQEKYINRISQSTGKLNKIIEDVLELVSAETGVKKLSKKKINTSDIVKNLPKEYHDRMQEKSQKLLPDLEGFSVKADPSTLENVLFRLVDNAIKFGPESSEIKIHADELDDGDVFISVSNKGKSIPKKTIDKILKPFTLDENMMNHTEGLGLGLSLCQALLKHHGSSLEFLSKSGAVTVGFRLSNK